MRFSICHVPASLSEDTDRDVLRMTAEQSIMADQQGYHAVFLPEHHYTGYAPAGADPVAFAAYLAPQLKQAWLGFAITVVPIWHPARLVERLNLLDQLLDGRLLVGLGSGISAVEHAGMGLNTDEMSAGMTEEILDVALKLWDRKPDDPELTFETKYYKGTILKRVVPAPYTRPHPKLMRAASRPGPISRAASEGWPVFVSAHDGFRNFLRRLEQYRRELLTAGHDEETLAFCRRWTTRTFTSVAIGDTEAEARQIAVESQAAQGRYYASVRAAGQRAFELGTTSRPPFTPDITSALHLKDDTIYGTAEQVIEQIREAEKLGIGNLLLSFSYGAYDEKRRALSDEQQQRFAEEVLPHFNDADPSRETLEMDLSDFIAAADEVQPEAIDHPAQRGI